MANLLIELGTEELPVDALDVVYAQLAAKTRDSLTRNFLSFGEIRVQATPRRIALFVKNIGARQEDQLVEASGPSVEKAYDASGHPSPALQGFLKSKNASVKDILVKDTPRGKYVVIEKKITGKPANVILPSLLAEIFTSLPFPKMQRWEKSNFRFPRPVRWIVALLDKKVIPFSLAGLKAGTKSYGHRFLTPKALAITSADWNAYRRILRKAHVILDPEERKALIKKGLEERYRQKDYDEDLVHITANLVEEPFLLDGAFSKSHLELPSEVLASCMKKNQKIFACYDAKGKLMSKFAGVLNGKRNGLSKIRSGFENVLESRLRDARYFYDSDTKEPLEKKLLLLSQIVYLGKLGNMLDKTGRMEKLAEILADMIDRGDLKEDLKRAARLSKIDLMTHLVYEFPDLQGIVGREYAIAGGEKESVAEAVGTQYLPKNLADEFSDLKKIFSPLGALFAIIDRLDLLVGAFGSGLEPTGSQDPYALRRAGGTIIKLIRAFRFPLRLTEAIEAAAGLYPEAAGLQKKEASAKLLKFFEDRVVFELQVKPGTRQHEILRAVFASSFDQLADVYDRYEMLSRLYERDPESFLRAAKVVERTSNILKGVKITAGINPELFCEETEKKLFRIVEEKSHEIEDLVRTRDYEQATTHFGAVFYQPVHDFFKEVMVNAEDMALRSTRQALVSRINRLYTEKLADLSVLSRLDQG